MEAFDKAIGLRVVRRRADALHAVATGKLVEVAVELGAVVRDNDSGNAVATYGAVGACVGPQVAEGPQPYRVPCALPFSIIYYTTSLSRPPRFATRPGVVR